MESKEYFEKVMQDYNQNLKGRSLRKYCKDEAVDYDWLIRTRRAILYRRETAGTSARCFYTYYYKGCCSKVNNLASGDLNSEISRRRAD